MGQPGFDAIAGHRLLSSEGFSKAWDLLDKSDRTPEDDEQMLLCAAAPLDRGTQRADATAESLSVGPWRMARVHAVGGWAGDAVRFRDLSLSQAKREGAAPYASAYVHEALARGHAAGGRRKQASGHVGLARKAMDHVADPETRGMLLADLATISTPETTV